MSSRSLKPIGDLRSGDLEAHWCWRFAEDAEHQPGQDETSVEPVPVSELSQDTDSAFAVADYVGPGGRRFIGLVQIFVHPSPKIHPAAIVTDSAYGPLIDPRHPLAESMLRFSEQQLGIQRLEIYPLNYRVRLPFKGESTGRTGVFTFGTRAA